VKNKKRRITGTVQEHGNVFDGAMSGKVYDRFAELFGFGPTLFKKAVALMPLNEGQIVLDLGCGTGAFCTAIANRIGSDGVIHGIDLSRKQLDTAGEKMRAKNPRFVPHLSSMDELPFSNGTFDLVICSLAIHAAAPPVRRAAIRETARVLKDGSRFILVDWTRPRTALTRLLYLPFSPTLMGERARDNWNNVYPALCEKENLTLETDTFLNSYIRYQSYVKTASV
jgi:demethylmenaquinone methyltransferase/2-methoxy-6-polyprenyl-1,4-benzoquinol methylase